MFERWLVVYYALAVIYAVYRLVRRKGDETAAVLLALLLPFGGVPLAALARYVRKRNVPVPDASRFKELTDKENDIRERIYRQVDIGKETNIVPIEEALVVNDYRTRRRLLLDMLKDDADGHSELLERAIQNEDTETSHYAVSAVMERKRKLQTNLQRLTVEYERQRGNLDVAAEYAQALHRMIEGGFADARTKKIYLSTYSRVLGELIAGGLHDESVFKNKIECAMRLGEVQAALADCEAFRKAYPDSEQAYLSSLGVCFELRQKESFFELLEQLKASRIRISNATLGMIRYWSNQRDQGAAG
ncbi:hypothetical protein [Cohnella massiliensis]|uniref:hypothetical protein n=1 Tax=Cohnella massiliensis TaxID=1816691 RepID=UPI001593E626|nr:hypothetical protein [Cohnella massiliensis]